MPERAATLVTALILDRPTCLDCIAQKTGLPMTEIGATLFRVRAFLRVHEEEGRCRACGETKRVVSISRPSE
jgi:hypothetical protein